MRQINFHSFKKSFYVFLLALIPAVSFSQSQLQNVEYAATAEDPNDPANMNYNVGCTIYLSDTLNVSSIQVKIGSQLNGSEKFSSMINFVLPVAPSGQTYVRNGNIITWNLGNILIDNAYYYEVELLDFQSVSLHKFIIQN